MSKKKSVRRRQPRLPLKRRVTFSVDCALLAKAEAVLADRGIELSSWLALQVGAITNTVRHAVGLTDNMPFGKYIGAPVEAVVRGDPGYMRWSIEKCPERFKPEVTALFEELDQ